jgi:hypothetical protein
MSRDLTSLIHNALDDDLVQPFFAVELLFDSAPIRLWTGLDTLVYQGENWIGTGNLLDISAVEETSEIAVRGATITLSGMNSEVISLALQSPYQGRVCNLYFGVRISNVSSALWILYNGFWNDGGVWLDEEVWNDGDTDYSLTQIFSGYMDEMNIDEGAEFGTIELKVENKLIDLERARVRRFSSGYQKSVYPGDKGLDFVEDLQDKEIVWGRKVEGGSSSSSPFSGFLRR